MASALSTKNSSGDEMVDTAAAARAAGIPKGTLSQWIASGWVNSIERGPRGRRRDWTRENVMEIALLAELKRHGVDLIHGSQLTRSAMQPPMYEVALSEPDRLLAVHISDEPGASSAWVHRPEISVSQVAEFMSGRPPIGEFAALSEEDAERIDEAGAVEDLPPHLQRFKKRTIRPWLTLPIQPIFDRVSAAFEDAPSS